MTTIVPAPPGSDDTTALLPAAGRCKRCGGPVPAGTGRGRTRVFCSDKCARAWHNDARPRAGTPEPPGSGDPLEALEQVLRQAAALAGAAREHAAALDPAAVRAQIAEAEAARHRAEAAARTAAARQGEADAEAQALSEALATARGDAARLAAELSQLHAETDSRIAAAAAAARDDAARERDALREACHAKIAAAQALADAHKARAERAESELESERADRRQLVSQLAAATITRPARGRARPEGKADAPV